MTPPRVACVQNGFVSEGLMTTLAPHRLSPICCVTGDTASEWSATIPKPPVLRKSKPSTDLFSVGIFSNRSTVLFAKFFLWHEITTVGLAGFREWLLHIMYRLIENPGCVLEDPK